jgi:hypothetical protein
MKFIAARASSTPVLVTGNENSYNYIIINNYMRRRAIIIIIHAIHHDL